MANVNNPTSDNSGSVIGNAPANPNNFGGSAGQAGQGANQIDYKEIAEGLERKLGTQGKELGDYRSFFDGISPLLNQLDKSPELVQAILDGKVDTNLAKAASEGRISVSDAEIITKANTEVKKDLGNKGYTQASPEDLTKMIEEKVNAAKVEMQGKLKEAEDTRVFEANVNEFIASTPDFADYAKDIDAWLDDHDITDIKVAYYAVKGQISDREAKKMAETNAAEMQKNMAANFGGGGSRVTHIPEGVDFVDSLIAGKSNPNVI